MKMNRFEKYAMNNPIRAFIQQKYEAPLLERLGGRVENMHVLEVGCGQGVGTELIFERFGASTVQAFDLDEDMVEKARQRLSRYIPERLLLNVGDTTAINAEDASFDAVFDFAIIHHVPDWQNAIAEISRVLKPGGRFFFEEVTRHALNKAIYKLLMEHPRENRFSGKEFVEELATRRIHLKHGLQERYFGDFIFGVGWKA